MFKQKNIQFINKPCKGDIVVFKKTAEIAFYHYKFQLRHYKLQVGYM